MTDKESRYAQCRVSVVFDRHEFADTRVDYDLGVVDMDGVLGTIDLAVFAREMLRRAGRAKPFVSSGEVGTFTREQLDALLGKKES